MAMLQERIIHLINAELDGEIDAAGKAELETVLESSAEARALRAELARLASLMDELPEQEPPAGLAGRILGRVRLPDTAGGARGSGVSLSGWFASFRPAQAGLAFAAGLLLTVGFYEVARNGKAPAELSSMVGTMVANPAAESGRLRDSWSIAEPGLNGTVTLGEVGRFLVLSFDLESESQTEIVVELAEAGLGFGGIAHASADSSIVNESYQVSGGTLRVVNQGRQVFSVFLPRVADPSSQQAASRDGIGRTVAVDISTDGAGRVRGMLRD